ncbi:MAG: extracellular solute-binding protein [Aggregatilineales bacterium]
MQNNLIFRSIGIVLFSIFFLFQLNAQSDIVITVALPDSAVASDLIEQAIADFQAQHYGIEVRAVSNRNQFVPPPSTVDEIDTYLNGVDWMASMADVISVSSVWLKPEATQKGYFLDLAPLLMTDSSIESTDFYAGTWDAFQWDGGVWGLPNAFSPMAVLYRANAFDEAGLSYPSELWTMSDFENVIRTFGQIQAPVMTFNSYYHLSIFIASLINAPTYYETTLPTTPAFSSAELASILESLHQLFTDGLIEIGYDPDAPLAMGQIGIVLPFGEENYSESPLSSGAVGAEVYGFSVSVGTDYPDEAYELAKYLTGITDIFYGLPARQSLLTESEVPIILDRLASLEVNAVISPAELRFTHYVSALADADWEGQTLETVLADLETQITARLNEIYASRQDTVVSIAPPPPPLITGENVINFGVATNTRPLPTESSWMRLTETFLEANPEMPPFNVEVTDSMALESLAARYDCFYVPRNSLSTANLDLIRNLDPLIDSDPDLNVDDFVGDVFSQVQINNQVWAFPMSIQPNVLWYNTVLFEEVGLPFPETRWTAEEFTTALAALRESSTNDDPKLITSYHWSDDNIHILMLIAAYGGLLIDESTNPPTIDFMSPESVNAVRQVLDLAVAGELDYPTSYGTPALIASPLDITNYRNGSLVTMGTFTGRDYQMITYPLGTAYAPTSYGLAVAYISAETVHIEACYDYIRFMAQQPQIFSSMPVLRSLLNDEAFLASRDAGTIRILNAVDEIMQMPNALEFPESVSAGGNPLYRWLSLAFDAYIEDGADLETSLAEAQQNTNDYLICVSEIEEPQNGMDYLWATYDCMETIDSAS